MNAMSNKNSGMRPMADFQHTGGDRHSGILERHPGLTTGAAVAHSGLVIELGDSTVATTMSEVPTTEIGMTAGKPLKVSVAQVLVYELRVRDAMTKPAVTAAPGDSLRAIQHLMKAHCISGVPILQNGVLAGLVSIEDIINALDHGYVNDPAERWMTRNIVTLRDHFSLVRAVAEFDRHGFGRFPVLNSRGELVGILTHGDITACLMQHLEKRAEESAANEAALFSGQMHDLERTKSVVMRTKVKAGNYDSAGKISQRMRRILRVRGVDPGIQRRAAIIAYEAEMNIVIHSVGGDILVVVSPEKVVIEAVDRGPGIENIDLAMKEGWSTAGPLARELGFGAGMGLPNVKKCSDKFEIHSKMSAGTHLHSEVLLNKAGWPPKQKEHQ